MARAALRPCTHPGCPALTDSNRCPKHKVVQRKEQDAHRGSSAERGYGFRWQKASKAWLRAHPLCACTECDDGRKRVTPAVLVDHRIPHRGDMKLFWDPSNWQSMAKACHDRKTAMEDGGFGNRGGGRAPRLLSP
jgi:5-methylcytosine-specific restriction protein A